ncbi:hypothetical protein JK628_06035 [Shewanella sp. KX20019]|uniref:hypothetical protein n=1 Tax=Shewanella sp. KX20019 TaxID=2803864 RepID=UPI001926AC0D|nr:hypothetical protein [Shewanella sp. KX20019]QQX81421.1 hypothetical protein JK628_06035 [Shewanella sp. KX20019]
MNNFKAIPFLLLALTSSSAIAHPGHDHSAPSADLLHLLWAAPVALAVVAAIVVIRKRLALAVHK